MGISNSEATTAKLIEQADSFDFFYHGGDHAHPLGHKACSMLTLSRGPPPHLSTSQAAPHSPFLTSPA